MDIDRVAIVVACVVIGAYVVTGRVELAPMATLACGFLFGQRLAARNGEKKK